RDLHPGAWWIWAIALAVAASRTTNPWLLATIIAVVAYVVVSRRSDAPWALSFRMYVYLGLIIIAMRVIFRIIFGGAEGGTVLVSLPEVPLPDWTAGIQLLGDVSLESILSGFYDGLRLATMIICLGAANALANPKRLLKAMPPALYEVATAVVVALSVFPQLAESVGRIRRARRLRGSATRRSDVFRTIAIPVLADALERSIRLAASMDARGYGRVKGGSRRLTGALLITGLCGICIGAYASQDLTMSRSVTVIALAAGCALAACGLVVAGRGVERTRYRPDHWQSAEILVAGSGVAASVAFWLTASADPLGITVSVATWPPLDWAPFGALLIGLLPAWLTPVPAPLLPTTAADKRELVTTGAAA
ncbi:MAG: energy-coupling factor transporter transmembrane protein EcfT, partial [Actinomycetia bacterium]|nr:energy-coupling factor transporter transmembrane protein EcfT [Actinomycetes bacterium]